MFVNVPCARERGRGGEKGAGRWKRAREKRREMYDCSNSPCSSYDQYGFSEAHVTADKESITNPLKIKAKKFDQRAQQALSVSYNCA